MTALRPHRHRRRAQGRLLALAALAVCLVASLGFSGAGASPLAAQARTGPVLTWSTVAGALHPPPLANASEAYDADNDTVVLFGGRMANGDPSNETWVWDGSSWTETSQSQAPPARQMASMAFDPGLHELILFGGQGVNGGILDDTWAWNGASWYQESALTSPTPREGAAMAYDGSQLVLFGGTGDDEPGSAPGSLGASTSAPAPSTSAAASTTASTGAVPVALDDTWLWTGTNWTQSTATGPSARSGAAMSYDTAKHETILFGGEATSAGSQPPSVLGDTWTWNGSGWKRANPHTSPSPREGAAAADDPGAGGVVLTGGELGAENDAADTWLWTGANWLKTTAGAPSSRNGAAAAYDPFSQQLVLFGGVSPAGTVHGDTNLLTSSQSGPGVGTAPPSGGGTTGSTTPAASSVVPGKYGTSYKPSGGQSAQAVPGTGSGGSAPPKSTATVVHRNERITLSGSGFQAGAPITITFHSTPLTVGYATADHFGYFHDTVSVPPTAAQGAHHFEATGVGESGHPAQLAFAVNVVGVSGHSRATKTQTLILVGVALLLPLAAWMILSGSDRMRARAQRRHRAQQPAQ